MGILALVHFAHLAGLPHNGLYPQQRQQLSGQWACIPKLLLRGR